MESHTRGKALWCMMHFPPSPPPKKKEPVTCLCDAELETREHIVFECQTNEEHRNIINEGAPDHQLATLRYKGGNRSPSRVCQKKQGVPKTKDPSKPIGDTGYIAERSGARGAAEHSNVANRTTRTQPVRPVPPHQKHRPLQRAQTTREPTTSNAQLGSAP